MATTTENPARTPAQYFLNKRRAIELGHLTAWSRKGGGGIPPNLEWLARRVITTSLRWVGLLERGRRNATQPVVTEIALAFENLPAAFDGFRVLHLTDLHADGIEGFGRYAAAALQDLEVDLCVITGDYRFETDGCCDAAYPEIEAIVAAVQSRHGIAATLGNHDSIEMVRPLERLGIRMLLNQGWEITRGGESLWVLGVDDPHYYGCDDVIGTSAEAPEEAFKMLLVHSPEIIEEAEAYGVNLYLCGHTHGGQIRLPGLGALYLNANCPRKHASGPWRFGRMHGYTSRGLGCSSVPVRFNCLPEIGLFTLRRAGQPADGNGEPNGVAGG